MPGHTLTPSDVGLVCLLLVIAVGVMVWEIRASWREDQFRRTVCAHCARCNLERARLKGQLEERQAELTHDYPRCGSCSRHLGMTAEGWRCPDPRCESNRVR
jgi:hypothetical protein